MVWSEKPSWPFCRATESKWQENSKLSARDYVMPICSLITVYLCAFFMGGIYLARTCVPWDHVVLHLDSCSITDFRVTGNQLVANWTARFMLIPDNNDTEISIEPFDLLVFYKHTELVSCASVAGPLALKTRYQAAIEVEFSPEGCKEALSLDDEVVREIEHDLKKGKISLDLGLELKAICKGIGLLDRHIELEPACPLDLGFNSTGAGLAAEPCSGNSTKTCRSKINWDMKQ